MRIALSYISYFIVQVGGGRGLHAAPIKAQKAALTLPPGSAEQLALFQAEEGERYSNPDQCFVYT